MVGGDEAVRVTKHWGAMRIRFKAAVHSGALNDELNDCDTHCRPSPGAKW